jgi:hypothetical protein
MRDKNGLIPVSSLRLAVHMGPATREVGPHRTAFIGTALSCTLVVDHEGQYWTIAPETGEAAVYTPLPGTRLYTLSDMRLDSLCQLADEIADINLNGFGPQALMMVPEAASDQIDWFTFMEDPNDLRYDNGEMNYDFTSTETDLSLFEDRHLAHVVQDNVSAELFMFGGMNGRRFEGTIDYQNRIVWFPKGFEPIIDSPAIDMMHDLQICLVKNYPGPLWAVVCEGADEETIARARDVLPSKDMFIGINPVAFTVRLDKTTSSSLTFEVVGSTQTMMTIVHSENDPSVLDEEFRAAIATRFTASGLHLVLFVPSHHWPRLATCPEFSRGIALAAAGIQSKKSLKDYGPFAAVEFYLENALFLDEMTEALDLYKEVGQRHADMVADARAEAMLDGMREAAEKTLMAQLEKERKDKPLH